MENIDHIRQPLIAGNPIPPSFLEEFGLLTLSSGCSASLLRNDWAICAAHCIDAKDGLGNTTPDPSRPGQNMLVPLAGLTLNASWDPAQTRSVVRVETFWPYDVALIQLNAPFSLYGSTTGYNRLIFQDGQFPYFGSVAGANILICGRGINQFASGEGDSATPSSSDGVYRLGYARVNADDGTLYWYPSEGGLMIAGGDSGGPSYAWVLSGYALVGVHALCHAKYVEGKPKTGWTWVTSTPSSADAPIMPLIPQLGQIMGPAPAGNAVREPYPPTGNVGKFAISPPDYQPMWVYGIQPNGDLLWYRKETNASTWQGPKTVGTGWAGFKDVIAAGGNRFYALTQDGRLLWYQHNGFNTGEFDWNGANEVGNGWSFKRIFAGGDGIIYAIRQDGVLLWYLHHGYKDGTFNWAEPTEIGTGWGDFRDVFSLGNGAIYAVQQDGTLLLYKHNGYKTGKKDWGNTRTVGSAWNQFQQIIPVGDGVILALRPDGALIWYRHQGRLAVGEMGRYEEIWDTPVTIGTNWQNFGKVFALIPSTPDGVH